MRAVDQSGDRNATHGLASTELPGDDTQKQKSLCIDFLSGPSSDMSRAEQRTESSADLLE